MSKSIIVTDISTKASESTVREFFKFAGKIKEFELKKEENSDKQIAYITFEKEEACRTSFLFNGSIMVDSHIKVKPVDEVHNDDAYSESEDFQHESESNKANSYLFVGILVAGYKLQKTIYETGSDIDARLGVSERFTQYLSQLTARLLDLDRKYKVYETVAHKASEIDNKFSVQDKVRSYASHAQDKASQALNTEPGKYAHELYTNTYKHIGVIQGQARKIACDEKDGGINGIEAH